MHRFSALSVALSALTLQFLAASLVCQESKQPRPARPSQVVWRPLFDGKTLAGWTQRNGTATYRVEDGAIVGTTKDGSPNSFLCTDRDYSDFELRFEVKVNDRLNSGVQIRSRPAEERASTRGPLRVAASA